MRAEKLAVTMLLDCAEERFWKNWLMLPELELVDAVGVEACTVTHSESTTGPAVCVHQPLLTAKDCS